MVLIFLMFIFICPFSKGMLAVSFRESQNVQPYAPCWKSQILKNSLQPNIDLFWEMKMRVCLNVYCKLA